MTIGKAKEIIKNYLSYCDGIADYQISPKELREAMECVASGDFLSDDKKDHPNAEMILVSQSLDLYHEDKIQNPIN